MTDRELFEKALKGLEAAYEGQIWLSHLPDLITALRERLAQPTTTAGYAKKIESLVAERDALKAKLAQPGQQDCWQEEARRYAQNAEFWRGKYEAAIAQQPDHIGDVNKMVLVEDLAAELFAVAQQSPADDGFSDTINRIEAWLRKHFTIPLQPEQEPFAWVDESAIRWLADRKGKTSAHCTTQLSAARSCEQPMPIYTAPQRREWVGLTDEEKSELDAEYGDDTLAHLDAIEAKLREKNT